MATFGARFRAIWVIAAMTSCQPLPNRNLVTDADIRAANSLLSLVEPCSLAHAGVYSDGGSIGGTLCDPSGKTLAFCYDRRLDRDEPPYLLRRIWFRYVLRDPKLYSSDPYLVFIGASYFTDSGAHPLAPGSVQEARFARLLSVALDRETGATRADSARGALGAETDAQHRAFTVHAGLRLLSILERRRSRRDVEP